MNKICALLGVSLFLFSCVSSDKKMPSKILSMEEQNVKGHWIAGSTDSTVTIIGVSSPMMKRDAEIAAAKEDAAKKAAMYYGVQGKIETTHGGGANFFDYISDSRVEVVYDKDYTKYIEQLTFDQKNDVLITKEAIFIRFKLAAAAKSINYTAKTDGNGRPTWTTSRQLPQFNGFITVVGFAQKQRYLKDTIYKATEAAVARIVETLSTKVSEKIVASAGSGNADNYSVSKGKLVNFHVIEFWVEPKTKNVYTLAIAKAAQ